MSDPEALAALKARSHWPNDADSATLAWLRTGSRLAFAAILASIVSVHLLRQPIRLLRRTRARITYAGGRTIDLEPGMTLLEASRSAGVPHASVCGGRARCSTCRVRIEKGLESLRPPTGAEAIGSRLDYLLDRPAAALVYTRNGHPVTVFALPRGNADAFALRGRRNGYHVLAWTEAGVGYLAASDLPAVELDKLEDSLSSANCEALNSVSTSARRSVTANEIGKVV